MVEPVAPAAHTSSNKIIEQQLDSRVDALERVLGTDVLAFSGLILARSDDLVREAVETRDNKKTKLVVVLETAGGYIEVAERIANTLRRHYQYVDFIIPNAAMSAGTVLAMSGDAIHMDYYSVLGPIDPQIERPGSPGFVPALGYLIQFERLVEKSNRGTLTTAELAYLVQRFDPGELYLFEQERELSISLLKEWLVKYKFKNWSITQTQQKSVTPEMKMDRAAEIALRLNNTERWHSHSRGIPMEVLRRDLKLQIEDFGESEPLNKAVREYHKLLTDYMMRIGATWAIHRYQDHFVSSAVRE
ncbi:MAG: serine dehydrogenasease [bacterium]|nr:serine dehydrogenasease [bacterium]